MINNLESIKNLLEFTSNDDYYLLEIIQRKKENPSLNKNSRIKGTYFVNSKSYLEKIFPEVLSLCNLFNARAGIRLSKRSFKKTAFNTLNKLSNVFLNDDFYSAKNAYNKSAGTTSSLSKDSEKLWIIDLDEPDLPYKDNIIDKINSISDNIIVAELPSKSGIHLITKPFNRSLFFYDCEIHKDNPTNLYIP